MRNATQSLIQRSCERIKERKPGVRTVLHVSSSHSAQMLLTVHPGALTTTLRRSDAAKFPGCPQWALQVSGNAAQPSGQPNTPPCTPTPLPPRGRHLVCLYCNIPQSVHCTSKQAVFVGISNSANLVFVPSSCVIAVPKLGCHLTQLLSILTRQPTGHWTSLPQAYHKPTFGLLNQISLMTMTRILTRKTFCCMLWLQVQYGTNVNGT